MNIVKLNVNLKITSLILLCGNLLLCQCCEWCCCFPSDDSIPEDDLIPTLLTSAAPGSVFVHGFEPSEPVLQVLKEVEEKNAKFLRESQWDENFFSLLTPNYSSTSMIATCDLMPCKIDSNPGYERISMLNVLQKRGNDWHRVKCDDPCNPKTWVGIGTDTKDQFMNGLACLINSVSFEGDKKLSVDEIYHPNAQGQTFSEIFGNHDKIMHLLPGNLNIAYNVDHPNVFYKGCWTNFRVGDNGIPQIDTVYTRIRKYDPIQGRRFMPPELADPEKVWQFDPGSIIFDKKSSKYFVCMTDPYNALDMYFEVKPNSDESYSFVYLSENAH